MYEYDIDGLICIRWILRCPTEMLWLGRNWYFLNLEDFLSDFWKCSWFILEIWDLISFDLFEILAAVTHNVTKYGKKWFNLWNIIRGWWSLVVNFGNLSIGRSRRGSKEAWIPNPKIFLYKESFLKLFLKFKSESFK